MLFDMMCLCSFQVRKVEYVNKDEAEWDNFMKEVSAAETESRQIIDEDAEAAAVRNQMLDVEERMQLCKKYVWVYLNVTFKRFTCKKNV